MAPYDLVGNIAIVKFKRGTKAGEKRRIAGKLMKQHQQLTTVLEKIERFKGRLRVQKTRYLAGVKTTEAVYKENGCLFWFDVEQCYFSPRLASERKEIAELVRKGENVLVMFGGVAPYVVAIARIAKPRRIVSVELSRVCNRYAVENVKRNKLEGKVEVVQGDVRRVVPRLGTFDRIVMPRPNLQDSFLDVALKAVKKGGVIHYYGFYREDEIGNMEELLEKEAKKARKRVKIMRVKKAGDIGVRMFRIRADVKVM